MTLPDGKGQLRAYGYSRDDFITEVFERVPEVEKHFDLPYQDDGVHIVFEALARLIRGAVKKRDSEVLERAFGLVNEAIERDDADPEIANAAYISFLGPEDITVLRDWGVWQLASPELKRYIRQEVWW